MSQDACTTSPAEVPSAITVSATDNTDTKASWANTGTCVDIFAPGVNTVSDWNTNDTSTNTISGTSMATPHVVGVAALYLQSHASATPSAVASALTSNATAGVVKIPGSGSPNKLLYMSFIGGGTGNQAPVANFSSSCSALACTFTDSSSDPDGSIAARAWDFGDGVTSTATNPSHTYASAGTFAARLTVTDNAGATGSTTKNVTVSSGGGGDPDPSTPTLSNGTARSDSNGAAGTWKYYKIQVPAGRSSLSVNLNGAASSCGLLSCNPDLDLFARRASKPTTSTYDCSGATGSASESCTISSPAPDWFYVGVYVYSGSKTITYSVSATT
jgi:PKD repeat protein